ncbi:hypothetical protein AXA44_37895 [Rhodococcus sp. SC4]|nr:hypothetical protein AXA44_37895 [Rhodococcus sp. SC4]
MSTESTVLRALGALHEAAYVDDPVRRWRIDSAALDKEMRRMQRTGMTLAETLAESNDAAIRRSETPYVLCALRLAADHPNFTDLTVEEQVRIAANYLPTEDLDAQVQEARELLLALARRVQELTGAADEQDRPNVANALSGVRTHLNTAAAELGEVIA